MRLKHKIYYIAIGVILLAVFQVGFQLRPQLAFAASHGHDADSHGHDETEGENFKLVKIGSLKARPLQYCQQRVPCPSSRHRCKAVAL